MRLFSYFFGSPEKQKLVRLLWHDGWSGSVHELSQLSGLSYATAYETLKKMSQFGLVTSSLQGKARVYTSTLDRKTRRLLTDLMKLEQQEADKPYYQSLTELGAPLVNEASLPKPLPLEALLCCKVAESKDNATLLRVLPVTFQKVRGNLRVEFLHAYARKNKVLKEVGFLLDLTAELYDDSQFKKWAGRFRDRRWKHDTCYFSRDRKAGRFKLALLDKNTPALAKKWHLKMNMDLDSFRA